MEETQVLEAMILKSSKGIVCNVCEQASFAKIRSREV